jgi:hypothetical protein
MGFARPDVRAETFSEEKVKIGVPCVLSQAGGGTPSSSTAAKN